MTEAWTFIDGRKVIIPMSPMEAMDRGWYKGAEYKNALHWVDTDFESIYTWCRETFDPHTYKMFMRSVWFLRESDATLCKLRWT
jgi:hypothetical protein